MILGVVTNIWQQFGEGFDEHDWMPAWRVSWRGQNRPDGGERNTGLAGGEQYLGDRETWVHESDL